MIEKLDRIKVEKIETRPDANMKKSGFQEYAEIDAVRLNNINIEEPKHRLDDLRIWLIVHKNGLTKLLLAVINFAIPKVGAVVTAVKELNTDKKERNIWQIIVDFMKKIIEYFSQS